MNSMVAQMPWTTPGPIGAFISTGFSQLSLLMMAILLIVDTLLYLPFFKVYDKQILEKEQAEEALIDMEEENAEETAERDVKLIEEGKRLEEEVNVLVLCAGGGTSGLLANALNEGAEEKLSLIHI